MRLGLHGLRDAPGRAERLVLSRIGSAQCLIKGGRARLNPLAFFANPPRTTGAG